MYIVSLIAALASGLLIAVQGVSNSVGSKLIGAPAMITWLSVVQAIPPLILLFWQKPSMGIGASILHGFKWYTISGMIGMIVITALSFAIPNLGALSVFVVVVLGQIIGAAVIDQIGLFGSPVISITPLRIVSICIIAVGVALLLKSGATHPESKVKTVETTSIHSNAL
ncbi:DMT family transporter [Ectobacillus funiculus]|uniref:DMT family transporter n=1 Tax=Ectobacillus funiculus TaxID=137993 RepID=UPI00397C2E0E